MMNVKTNLIIVTHCLLIAWTTGSRAQAQQVDRPPNIVFIMSDDHAYQAISAYGHGLNHTPNIDRIAQEGAIFTRATVTNSICAPSRAVLLTGKHSFINGKVDNVQPFNWDQENFPKLLQANGYQTALIGKIHLDGLPQGFDYSMVLPGQGQYYNPDFLVNGKKKRFEGYVTDITTDEAMKWLKETRDKDKPFCLMYHQKAPHRNWEPSPKYLTLYDDTTFTPPANYFDAATHYAGRGTAAKEQEMEIDGDARWGHDFKMVVDRMAIAPASIKTWRASPTNNGRSGMLPTTQRMRPSKRRTPATANSTLPATKPEKLRCGSITATSKITCAPSNQSTDGVGEVLDYLKKTGWPRIPLWCTPPTRGSTWASMAGSTSGLCTSSRSVPRC